MSITSNFPAIKPTLLLDFANTKQLDSRITFTRASTATYYGTQTAKAEENLLLQSQDFATTWTTTSLNATITANTTAAPDGTTTADTLTDDATSGIHRVSQTVTTSNTLQMVYSVFAKYSTMRWISISAATGTGTWAGAKFDVQNGVLGSTSQQGTGFTADSSSITSVGNGWYRCVLVYTAGASGSTSMLVSGATDGTTFTTSQRGSEVYIGSGSAVFLWGAQLEQRSAVTAYTVTTTQSITNYIPQLLTAASGVARFDNNPTTFESLGLEIEESRTNLQINSEDFTNADWTKGSNTTITANTIVSPAGTLTADTFGYTSITSGVLQVADNQTKAASSITYTSSVYVKASSNLFLHFYVDANSTSNSGRVIVDTSTWTVLSSTNFGTFTSTSGTVNAVGNGWYRITCTTTSGTETNIRFNLYWSTVNNTITFTPVGTENVYIWGAQLEAGAFATSYIPTVASQVTRAADAASMTGTNFSSWYNQGEGTLYGEFSWMGLSNNDYFFAINNSSANNLIALGVFSTPTTRFIVVDNTVTQASISGSTPVANTAFKIAGAYQVNNFRAATNGTLGTADTSGTVPTGMTEVSFNSSFGTVNNLTNGHIRKVAYYPLAVTSAQLQGLTS